jgi:hypothetical protein
MRHALVKLARAIDWRFLEGEFGAAFEVTKVGDKPTAGLMKDIVNIDPSGNLVELFQPARR